MAIDSFSKTWNSSVKARKQRKFRFNAPLHIRQKFMHVHLSKELRTKYGVRNAQVHKGDKVRIMRGQFHKREAVVERVSLHFCKVYLTGVDVVKRDGSKVQVALEPSNLLAVELDLKDKRRKEHLEAAKNKGQDKVQKVQKAALVDKSAPHVGKESSPKKTIKK